MENKEKVEGMLSPYRVLDLTDEESLLCGKILGDLGADVIKIEPQGGNRARNIGPFYHDEADPEKSLFWFAFNTNKRGVTLDIETPDGQEVLKRLVETADFVIESFPPGYMEKHGLSYSELEKIKPSLIMVSITPFGQTGPYRNYNAPDIVVWAMGGQMYLWGDTDRTPLRVSHHSQSYLLAATAGAAGAMMALCHREMTGEGQQVDVSAQECVIRATSILTSQWDMVKENPRRGIGRQIHSARATPKLWPCKDGLVRWQYWAGSGAKLWNSPLADVMESLGTTNDYLKEFDWDKLDFETTRQEVINRIAEETKKFFIAHTRAELMDTAAKHGAQLFSLNTVADILNSPQLAARGYWTELEHTELGTTITYPGAFVYTSEVPPRVWRRAPLIGEHNKEVYEDELGISGQATSRRAAGYSAKPDNKNRRQDRRRKPLEGIKVVDFGWSGVGPITAKILSDYGAEVLKIESRGRPDNFRTAGPFKDGIPGWNRGGEFNQRNTGKLSLALNLSHPKGVEIAKRFVAQADIVSENFSGGAMERMGLGYDVLRKIKTDIIMLSASMQGQTGPHANLRGFGPHLTALTGFNQIAGWPDRYPADLGAYTDFISPLFNVTAILAALDHRRRTGTGQYLDMSQYEADIHFLAPLILDYVVNQRVATRTGNRHPQAAPHNAYRCCGDDRWCAIAVSTDKEWESFCQVIGNLPWTKDSRFTTHQARKDNEEELDRMVEEWTVKHSAEEVMSLMQAAGVAAGVLQTAEDLLENDPQLKHRHSFWELDHPEIGMYRASTPPFMLSKTPYELRRAPLLGEHNEYTLKQLLGMSDEEIAQLAIEGVLE